MAGDDPTGTKLKQYDVEALVAASLTAGRLQPNTGPDDAVKAYHETLEALRKTSVYGNVRNVGRH